MFCLDFVLGLGSDRNKFKVRVYVFVPHSISFTTHIYIQTFACIVYILLKLAHRKSLLVGFRQRNRAVVKNIKNTVSEEKFTWIKCERRTYS